MNTGIRVGGVPDAKDTAALTQAICRVMSQPCDQKTIRAGLAILQRHATTQGVTVSTGHLDMSTHHHHPDPAPVEADQGDDPDPVLDGLGA